MYYFNNQSEKAENDDTMKEKEKTPYFVFPYSFLKEICARWAVGSARR